MTGGIKAGDEMRDVQRSGHRRWIWISAAEPVHQVAASYQHTAPPA